MSPDITMIPCPLLFLHSSCFIEDHRATSSTLVPAWLLGLATLATQSVAKVDPNCIVPTWLHRIYQ